MKFSILIPSYNGEKIIEETLRSILAQSFSDYEIIVSDDASKDKTEEIVKSLHNPKIKFFRNKKNLGYPGNLNEALKYANGEIIYLMGQDDILGKDVLLKTNKAFKLSEDIGGVARPYFWFDKKIEKPVRATGQLNPNQDEIVRISDSFERIIKIIDVAGQLSGLALRRKYLELPFHPDIFPCHVYPFIAILKKHPIVFLKDYSMAVRIRSSQCRSVSSIYDKSPIQSWVYFFNNIFPEEKFKDFREYAIKNYVAKNYVGLIQIRNYAKYRYLLREIWYLLKYRWQNIFSFQFWFFSLGCLVIPPFILIPLVDWYKNKINSKKMEPIKFEYDSPR